MGSPRSLLAGAGGRERVAGNRFSVAWIASVTAARVIRRERSLVIAGRSLFGRLGRVGSSQSPARLRTRSPRSQNSIGRTRVPAIDCSYAQAMQPTYLRTAADVAALIVPGRTQETLVLEFKEDLAHSTADWQRELCRDLAQFANTWGGCLLLGVSEHIDPATNLKVADRIDGVPKPDETRERIEQAIQNHLVPSTLAHDVVLIQLPPSPVVVSVNVPPSPNLVYVWDRNRHAIECVHRTSHGKAYMNPHEMELHAMNTTRARMLKLKAAVDRAPANGPSPRFRVASGCYRRHKTPGPLHPWAPGLIVLVSISDDAFVLSVPLGDGRLILLTVPFELLRASWTDADTTIALMLDVRVVLESDGLILEPYEAWHG